MTVTLTPADYAPGATITNTYGSSVDGAPSGEGTSVLIPAPTDGSNNGTHTITYYSTDSAGHTEAAHSCTVTDPGPAADAPHLSQQRQLPAGSDQRP